MCILAADSYRCFAFHQVGLISVGTTQIIQNWTHLTISQCCSYCGPSPSLNWKGVICIGVAQFCTVLSHSRCLNFFPVTFPSPFIIEPAGFMVMSPFELSVCVYFHLHCWHLFWTFSPSVQINYLHYQICLIVHSSTAVDTPDPLCLLSLLLILQKAL